VIVVRTLVMSVLFAFSWTSCWSWLGSWLEMFRINGLSITCWRYPHPVLLFLTFIQKLFFNIADYLHIKTMHCMFSFTNDAYQLDVVKRW